MPGAARSPARSGRPAPAKAPGTAGSRRRRNSRLAGTAPAAPAGASCRRAPPCRCASAPVEAAAAGLAVALVAADADLLALADAPPFCVDADVHGRFFPAGADVLDLLDVVGQCQ